MLDGNLKCWDTGGNLKCWVQMKKGNCARSRRPGQELLACVAGPQRPDTTTNPSHSHLSAAATCLFHHRSFPRTPSTPSSPALAQVFEGLAPGVTNLSLLGLSLDQPPQQLASAWGALEELELWDVTYHPDTLGALSALIALTSVKLERYYCRQKVPIAQTRCAR